jgi:hypothetical protein
MAVNNRRSSTDDAEYPKRDRLAPPGCRVRASVASATVGDQATACRIPFAEWRKGRVEESSNLLWGTTRGSLASPQGPFLDS